jgi:hypothetical protein
MEKNYLNYYTKVFKAELVTYLIFANVLLYGATATIMKNLNRNVIIGMVVPGMIVNAYCVYGRIFEYRILKRNVEDMYGPQLEKYELFFRDKGYDD